MVRINDIKDEHIQQSFNVDQQFKIKTNRYHLSLDIVPTSKAELKTPLALLTWNGIDFPLSANKRYLTHFNT